MTKADPFDPANWRLDPATFPTPPAPVPAKIKKRREQFVMLPMWWYEKLANPVPACRCTCLVALYLLHLDWKNHGKPFNLANGMLEYDGIGRHSKWRALEDLEQRSLISVERRNGKSPTIHVHTQMVHR
jgi:hypothetical protein